MAALRQRDSNNLDRALGERAVGVRALIVRLAGHRARHWLRLALRQRSRRAVEGAGQLLQLTSSPNDFAARALLFGPHKGASAVPERNPRSPWGNIAPRSQAPGTAPAPALLNDLATAASLLHGDLLQERMLDAYLRAAGMAQVTDDYLHPEIYPLDRAAGEISRSLPVFGRLAAAFLVATANAVRAIRACRPSMRRVRRWREDLDEIVEMVARDVQAGVVDATRRTLRRSAALTDALTQLPEDLRAAVVRLPACFHTFDQQPVDLDRLIEQFAERHPERRRTLLVVGVRTSGSYLAPLCAAALRETGYHDVRVLTVRPDRALLAYERALIRSVSQRRGLVLLTDDPPVTGSSIVKAARELERAGLRADAIVLLLQVFGSEAVVPPSLRGRDAVLLPSSRWVIAAKLTPGEVRNALSRLLGEPTSVLAVEPARLPGSPPSRGHVRALFRVVLSDRATGEQTATHVLVEGVGLGFLGAHVLPLARELQPFMPKVFGLRDGVLYREWLPDERRVKSEDTDEQATASAIATYVATRQLVLPVDTDLSLRLSGQDAAWEVASLILSRIFGRAWPIAKVLLIDRTVKRVLRVQRPAIVDGNTDLAHWFYGDRAKQSLVKVDLGENRFSNLGLCCFDATFDLAGVSAMTDSPTLARRLRHKYTELTNEQIDEERWLLYELAHLWGRGRTQPASEPELQRARSRALQRYFAAVYFADVTIQPDGPLCALDVDGVLETEQLGFPALTPAAALALRALALHGYQPLLATGRSLNDVTTRCRSYPLAGGVAEYGSVTYEHRGGTVRRLVSDQTIAALERLRATLEQTPGIGVDGEYQLSVRAFMLERGQRAGLRRETIDQALAQAEVDGIRAVHGEGQTDFIGIAVNKGTAVRALAAQLHEPKQPPDDRPLELAVGDTLADAPLRPLAALALAPAHASNALRKAGFELTSKPYQAGLAQAVGKLIGHPPGTCELCRMPHPTTERKLLLKVLATPEHGAIEMALHALKLTATARFHA
jgi:hydroxymethylpyrimidine pyrophosphatase-like HAD family hydrolase